MGKHYEIINALDYMDAQFKEEWNRDYKAYSRMNYYGCKETSERMQKMEREFYRHIKSTPALEAAIAAINRPLKQRKTKE